jgi:carboxypeptidase Q
LLYYFYQMKRLLTALLIVSGSAAFAQDSVMLKRISDQIMLHGRSYEDLRVLCKQVGHRLSGSPQAVKAIEWGQKALTEAGADKVWLQPVDVPRWTRGKESLKIRADKGKYVEVPMLSLGNSVGTDGKVLEATIVMVKNFEEFNALSNKDVKGKVVFFNYRFRQDLINTFDGYGDAGPYRWMSPNLASAKGAVGVIIRSISTGLDDAPHTGSIRYADTVKHIPAVAIGNISADMLEQQFAKGYVTAQIQTNCRMEGTVRSYNVIGEITGTNHPDHVILAGGHLDSWDVGEGAHDDGAGCVQAIEMIRTFKRLNIRPKNTIRAVLFMNEENGLKGGLAYGDSAKTSGEKHILAIESDAGGFSPRGIGLGMDDQKEETIKGYRKLFLPYGIYNFDRDGGGADISPLKKMGVPVAGLQPDPQRYFDLHHTPNDVFEQVNHRELKLGAFAITGLVYLVDQYGL